MFLVCPAIYIGYRALPFLIFYLVPLVFSAWLVGYLWRCLCEVAPTSYRRVAILMPVTILILVCTIGFPVAQPSTRRAGLQSLWLHRKYNGFRREIEARVNESWLRLVRPAFPSALPPIEYEPANYDLRDLAWCLWLGVCFGAPAVFLIYAKKKDEERIRVIEEEALALVTQAKAEANNAHREIRRQWSVRDYEISIREEEIKKLKALAAGVPATNRPALEPGRSDPEPEEKGGIFESDDI